MSTGLPTYCPHRQVKSFQFCFVCFILNPMKYIWLMLILLTACCGAVAAQVPVRSCPEIVVVGPSGPTRPGNVLSFTVMVRGGENVDAEKLKYQWYTSYRTIEGGQGTRSVTIRSNSGDASGDAGIKVTVTVGISGLPPGCPNTASETAEVSDFGQNKPPPCPNFRVDGPSGVLRFGDNMTFSLKIEPPPAANLKYHWTTSSGSIIRGQGTSNIVVKDRPKGDVSNVTATVEIKGLPPGCVNSGSETVGVPDESRPTLIDEYGRMPFSKEKLHLDNLVHQLRTDHQESAVFVIYPQKTSEMAAVKRRVANIKKYLRSRGVPKKRFTFVFGPNRMTYATKIWLIYEEDDMPVL